MGSDSEKVVVKRVSETVAAHKGKINLQGSEKSGLAGIVLIANGAGSQKVDVENVLTFQGISGANSFYVCFFSHRLPYSNRTIRREYAAATGH